MAPSCPRGAKRRRQKGDSAAAQQVVKASVLVVSVPAHQSNLSSDPRVPRAGGNAASRGVGASPKNGHSASGSQQQDCEDVGAHEAPRPRTVRPLRGEERLHLPGRPQAQVKSGNQSHFGRSRQKLARHARRTRAAPTSERPGSERTGDPTTKLFVKRHDGAVT